MTAPWYITLQDTGAGSDPALKKLDRLATYPDGWAYGDGVRFERSIVESTRDVLMYARALGLTRTDVFPRRDGGLVGSVYIDSDTYDFVVFANGTMECVHELAGEEVECRPTQPEQIQKKLAELARQSRWSLSESLSLTSTTTTWVALKATLSSLPAVTARYPASNENVLFEPQAGLVGT